MANNVKYLILIRSQGSDVMYFPYLLHTHRGRYNTRAMVQRRKLAHLKENVFSFQMQKKRVFYLYFWLGYSHLSKMMSNKYFKAFIRDMRCFHWRIYPLFGCFAVSYVYFGQFGVGRIRSNIRLCCMLCIWCSQREDDMAFVYTNENSVKRMISKHVHTNKHVIYSIKLPFAPGQQLLLYYVL